MTRITSNQDILAKIGFALIAIYSVTILFTAFPLNFSSAEWGRRASSIIIDACSLALVGTGLLRFCPTETADSEQNTDQDLPVDTSTSKQSGTRLTAVKLANAGFIGLLLLAAWQFLVFFGSVNESDIQAFAYTKQVNARFDAAELSIRQAPDQVIQKAPAPETPGESLSSESNSAQSIQAKRAQLLEQIRSERKSLESNANKQLGELRWKAGRDSLRIFLSALIYAWAFRGLAKL